jgi:hypothetical protein
MRPYAVILDGRGFGYCLYLSRKVSDCVKTNVNMPVMEKVMDASNPESSCFSPESIIASIQQKPLNNTISEGKKAIKTISMSNLAFPIIRSPFWIVYSYFIPNRLVNKE